MISALNKQAYAVQRNYPFLENFPFSEFKIELAEALVPNVMEDDSGYQSKVIDPRLIKFLYQTEEGGSMAIVIFEQELNWIDSISEKIVNIDKAVKIIDGAIAAKDIISKRNGVLFTEFWCQQLQDKKTRLSYSTSGEILSSLIENHQQMVSIINKIVKLSIGRGLVGLSAKEYQIIITYYQYQLIYAKLLLGIVISSKISL